MSKLNHLFFLWWLLLPAAQAQELPCVDDYADSLATHSTRDLYIESQGDSLFATLYLPGHQKPKAVVILVPGGGNNAEILRITPQFLSVRMANCGLATLTFDKRGVGRSGGEYASSTFRDFIRDVSNLADALSEMEELRSVPIGAAGFSQGGRLVPNIALQNKKIRFIGSVSGPITGVGRTRSFAFRNSVLESQLSDSLQEIILPVWEAQFAALDNRDTTELNRIDELIRKKAETLPRGVLPPYSADIPQTPIYNSMGIDFVSELDQLEIPWLSLYGEWDRVVPVAESIANIRREMEEGGNTLYQIEVLPKGDHSLRNSETGEWYPMEQMLIGWILEQL